MQKEVKEWESERGDEEEDASAEEGWAVREGVKMGGEGIGKKKEK